MSGSSHGIGKLRHFLINGKYFDYNARCHLYLIVFISLYLITDGESHAPVAPVQANTNNGITPTQLNRVWREVLGKSAFGAINARLLLEAERDLVYTFIGVKEIALSFGFSDAAYFSRFFSKQKRCTPTQFREQAQRQLSRGKAR